MFWEKVLFKSIRSEFHTHQAIRRDLYNDAYQTVLALHKDWPRATIEDLRALDAHLRLTGDVPPSLASSLARFHLSAVLEGVSYAIKTLEHRETKAQL